MFLASRDAVPEGLRHGVVAIGNFDGVHRGHQAVLKAAIERARIVGGPVAALTFEPHPRQFFRPDVPLFRLTPDHVKAELFAALGLSGAVTLTFDADIAALSAEAFVKRWIADGFAADQVIVGYDFHFGKGREGSPVKLSALGLTHGFQVTIVGAQSGEGDTPYSSTAVREALADGRLEEARGQLGYRWFFESEVVHGEKRGRDLGYPTANMALDPAVTLRHGVYAVRARDVRSGGPILFGVASFGRRPQFDNGAPLFETHFFDFADDLYGRPLEIELIAFLRPEARFDSVETLIEQMDRDSVAARHAIADVALDPFGPEALTSAREQPAP
ncbi:MAG: bifunctional riboflavin kinase/FAD synthetase [Pseudomonadota bacterium]